MLNPFLKVSYALAVCSDGADASATPAASTVTSDATTAAQPNRLTGVQNPRIDSIVPAG
jgi:uncharacterized lipoprotein YbaY